MCIRPMAWRWRARSAMPPMLTAPIRRGSKHSMPMSGCVRNCRRQRPTRRYRQQRQTRRRRQTRKCRPQRSIQRYQRRWRIPGRSGTSAPPAPQQANWLSLGMRRARVFVTIGVRWVKVGENYRTWTDLDYNAYPTTASLTISGLEGGERYKIAVRARFAQGSGPWAQEVRADVMALVSQQQIELAPATNTATNTPTNTAIPPADTAIPTATNTATATDTAVPTANGHSDTANRHRDTANRHRDTANEHSSAGRRSPRD